MKRAASIAIADGGLMTNFTLQSPCPFALLSEMGNTCVELMNMFIPPNSSRFPIAVSVSSSILGVNGLSATQTNQFVRFLRMGIAKSLVFHMVYRRTKSANTIRILADVNRAIFRDSAHLPPATLAFVGACVSRFCLIASYSFNIVTL